MKKIEEREREPSPIKNENFEIIETKDFKENFLNKSWCTKMDEDRTSSYIKALELSQKINIMLSPIANKKEEILDIPDEKYIDIPKFVMINDLLLLSSKKSNRIFEPLSTPDLPQCLKQSQLY